MKRHYFPAVALLAILLSILSGGCGKTPSGMPRTQAGDLMITAQDTSLVDSVTVRLDFEPAETRKNPCFLADVVAGFHRLHVYTAAAAGSVFTSLEVADRETTFVEFTLNSGPVPGAFVGNIAPGFEVQDVNGQTVRLSDLQSRVVLLLFVEYT